MSEADATLARLLKADRRFTELSKQPRDCGGDATLAGDHQATTVRVSSAWKYSRYTVSPCHCTLNTGEHSKAQRTSTFNGS
jgi:hypothetical protein